MSIRIILAPLTGREPDDTALAAGLLLARRLDARVEVVHVSPDPADALPKIMENWEGGVAKRIMTHAATEYARLQQAAERLCKGACAKTQTTVSGDTAEARFITLTGRAPETLRTRSRCADLILFPRGAEEAQSDWQAVVVATLMGSGRPVLLLPQSPPPRIGNAVAIAWNGSVEAARAASAALPILAEAEQVFLLASPDGTPPQTALEPFANWLRRHNVRAAPEAVPLRGRIDEALFDAALVAGADLVVMGGYGHSRTREMILGGATRTAIARAPLPVLLAH